MPNDQEIIESIKEINQKLTSIDKTLIEQSASIKHHIYRSDLLEQAVGDLRHELEPIKRHVITVEGSLKLLGILAVLSGLAASIVKVIQYLGK